SSDSGSPAPTTNWPSPNPAARAPCRPRHGGLGRGGLLRPDLVRQTVRSGVWLPTYTSRRSHYWVAVREGIMRGQFLAVLRQNPRDVAAWLAYSDWLEEAGDSTAAFIRLSLEITAGRFGDATPEARVSEFVKLHAAAAPEARELMATYRSSLPTR